VEYIIIIIFGACLAIRVELLLLLLY